MFAANSLVNISLLSSPLHRAPVSFSIISHVVVEQLLSAVVAFFTQPAQASERRGIFRVVCSVLFAPLDVNSRTSRKGKTFSFSTGCSTRKVFLFVRRIKINANLTSFHFHIVKFKTTTIIGKENDKLLKVNFWFCFLSFHIAQSVVKSIN